MDITGTESLKFYVWAPFPKTEGALITKQVQERGGVMWDSHHQADIIFAYVQNGPAVVVVQDVRRVNGRAILIALIRRGAGGIRQRCLKAGANMAFSMPTKVQGFKAMFTRIYQSQ